MTFLKDKASGLRVVPLWIDGRSTASTPSTRFPVVCLEQNNKTVHLAEAANSEAAVRAVDSSWKAFQSWKHTPVAVRRSVVQRAAALLLDKTEELVNAQRQETSVIETWARKNVTLAAELAEEIAACISSVKGEIPPTASPGSLGLVLHEPIGPILAIAPWNSSVILGMRAISTPIAAGCTVVLKASELCPLTHNFLAEIYKEAGLPDGVLNVIQSRREDAPSVTETLIAHPKIRKIDFIGSAPVGKIIGQIAAKYLKPVLMELGGKGPAIVLDDANLEEAARKCIVGAYLHHGQLCFATERIIVLEKIAPRFIELLKRAATNFPTGSAVTKRQLDASRDKLIDARDKGATFILGGPGAGSSSLEPSILTDVTPNMTIFDEESFGPSVTVIVARDDAHAIEIANDTAYGLNAAVHSENLGRALGVARQLDTAQVHVNNMTAHDEPTLPVGGVKGSGWGRSNASWGLHEYIHPKLITLSSRGNDFI